MIRWVQRRKQPSKHLKGVHIGIRQPTSGRACMAISFGSDVLSSAGLGQRDQVDLGRDGQRLCVRKSADGTGYQLRASKGSGGSASVEVRASEWTERTAVLKPVNAPAWHVTDAGVLVIELPAAVLKQPAPKPALVPKPPRPHTVDSAEEFRAIATARLAQAHG